MSQYTFVEKKVTDLRQLLTSSAELYADKPRYVYRYKRETFTYTYREMLDCMNALGTAFIKMGIGGETVAVIGETHPAYITTYFAVVNGNGCIVPLDKELSDEEIVNFLNYSHSKAVVYTSESFCKRFASMEKSLPEVKYFIRVSTESEYEGESPERFVTYGSLLTLGRKALSEGFDEYLHIRIDMEKCCALLFTSGTMGIGKGVMLSQKNLAAATNSSCATMSFMNCDTRLLSVLPIHHTYEMTTGQLAATNKGMTSYINESLKYFTKNTSEYKPTALLLVPLFVETMDKRIWDSIASGGLTRKVRRAVALSNALRKIGIDKRRTFFKEILSAFGGELEYIVCGGAALDDEIIKRFDDIGITVLNGYGITECSPLVSVNTPEQKKSGTIGLPVPGCSVRIENPGEDGAGEIAVFGDNVMLGYYGRPDLTAEAFTPDHWFKTGDVGYIDSEGYIHITGRKKNMIILSNGKNIYPEEIEHYLGAIPLIKECVVVGRKNGLGETAITCIVYPDPNLTEDMTREDIHEALKNQVNEINKKLPVFKQVRNVEVRYEEFEKTTTKKIKRYKVQ